MKALKNIIWIVILTMLALGIGYASKHYNGTVVFSAMDYRVSMTLFVFILLFGLVFFVLYFLWRMYATLVGLPSRMSNWRAEKREDRSLAALQTATLALYEGRWAHADKASKIAARHPKAVGLAALLGAASAHAQQNDVQAKEWLDQLSALEDARQFDDAKAMQYAQIDLDQGNATAALVHLDKVSPAIRKTSVRFKDLLIGSHAQAGHWHEVLQQAFDRKWSVSVEVKNQWHIKAIKGLCADTSSSGTYLAVLYKDMPDELRADDDLMLVYTDALVQRHAKAEARRVIEEAMRVRWRPALLKNYVKAAEQDSLTDQMKMLDAWEAQQKAANQPDAELYSTAGQICYLATLWGRSKKNFQDSLAIKPSVAAHHGLAMAARAMNEEALAVEQERKAAELAVAL